MSSVLSNHLSITLSFKIQCSPWMTCEWLVKTSSCCQWWPSSEPGLLWVCATQTLSDVGFVRKPSSRFGRNSPCSGFALKLEKKSAAWDHAAVYSTRDGVESHVMRNWVCEGESGLCSVCKKYSKKSVTTTATGCCTFNRYSRNVSWTSRRLGEDVCRASLFCYCAVLKLPVFGLTLWCRFPSFFLLWDIASKKIAFFKYDENKKKV